MPPRKKRVVDSDSESSEVEVPTKSKGKGVDSSFENEEATPRAKDHKRRLSNRPILALSGSSSNSDLRRSLGTGAPSKTLVNGAKNRHVSGGRGSIGSAAAAALLGLPGSPANSRALAHTLSRELMDTNYETWMKLATDNKINSTNTWNLELIDYFAEMSLLRNAENASINFQKASATLDGCVKIWTLRVDSVATETGKLLNGLADGGQPMPDSDDENEEGAVGGDEEGNNAKKKRKNVRSGNTLAPSFQSLALKKDDLKLEFTVDPLFKKTSADFDEGGAAGMLMNHLRCDRNMRIIFDALESYVDQDAPAEEDEDLEMTVNIAGLLAKNEDVLDELDNMMLCPSLANFKFNSDDSAIDFSFGRNTLGDSISSTGLTGLAQMSEPAPPAMQTDDDEQYFEDGPAVHDDDGPAVDFFGGGDAEQDEDMNEQTFAAPHGGPFAGPAAAVRESDLIMAMSTDDGVFEYFDQAMAAKNWAGPEHYRIRKVVRKDDKPKKRAAAGDDDDATPKKGRKTKDPLQADFSAPPPNFKDLFATSKASTQLSGNARSDTHVLPDDMHFSSQQLLRLFLKPKAAVNVRKRGRQLAPVPEAAPQELDENYWAQRAEQQMQDNAEDDDQSMAMLPFATQFFNDDGPDYDDDLAMGDDIGDAIGSVLPEDGTPLDGDVDLLAATKGKLKRVRPEFVNYAKKAKRVDVRRLKDTIWKELAIAVEPSADDEDDDMAPESDDKKQPDFNSVISGLRKVYPKDKMEELSTSWLFICTLHLANEHGLRLNIEREAPIEDIDEDQCLSVGDLTSLKVYRENLTS